MKHCPTGPNAQDLPAPGPVSLLWVTSLAHARAKDPLFIDLTSPDITGPALFKDNTKPLPGSTQAHNHLNGFANSREPVLFPVLRNFYA